MEISSSLVLAWLNLYHLQVEEELKAILPQPPKPAEAAIEAPAEGAAEAGGDAMDTVEAAAAPPPQPAAALSSEEARKQAASEQLHRVIRGEASIQLYLEFLHSHNHADLQAGAPFLIDTPPPPLNTLPVCISP